MTRPRVTIGRLMLLIAGAAGLLALGRGLGLGLGTVVGASLGAGWVAWLIGRVRPTLVFWLFLAASVGVPALAGVIAARSRVEPVVTAGTLLMLAYPTLAGAGLAWLRTGPPAAVDRAWGLDAVVIVVLILGLLPVVVVVGFVIMASLSQAR